MYVYIFFICKKHTRRPSPTTLTLKADMLPSLHSLVLLHSFICYSYNFNFDICRYKTFLKKTCQNDGYCMEMPKMVRTEKTAFKSKYMCVTAVCVCTLRCTRVRSPKVLCTRVDSSQLRQLSDGSYSPCCCSLDEVGLARQASNNLRLLRGCF